MGLDFSHSEAHWAYSGFGRFRTALAKHEGIDLDQMQGFGGDLPWEPVTTPLKPLLDHSDCDGEITPQDCAAVAPHLRTVIAAIWTPDDYDYRTGMELADGMDAAAKAGESLDFC